MPIHDWSRVDAGIFHHFHHAWIERIKRLLNSGVLRPDHYAMAEQHTSHELEHHAGFALAGLRLVARATRPSASPVPR
jgi:hypothetical protein